MISPSSIERAPFALPAAVVEAVVRAYASPPRAYHSLVHVEEVLAHFFDVQDRLGWAQPNEIFAALLFHDAVYIAGAKDNEARSAQLARQVLVGLPVDLNRVEQLIGLTAMHGRLDGESLDRDAALFVDCDMAILGASPERFAGYDAAIAEEYRGVTTGLLYRMGRKRFLEKLLAAPRIFWSDDFHARFDAAARRNLAQAIKHPAA